MFSLFRSRREKRTEVVPDEGAFFRRYAQLLPSPSVFRAHGEEHGDIDSRLIGKIEAILVPLLGKWEQSSIWFHQMDYFGDGVRSLLFQPSTFPREHITKLQALLVGEHAQFTIVCHIEAFGRSAPQDIASHRELLAIFSGKMLVTKRLADLLSTSAHD